MSEEKKLKARVVHKHKTEANWRLDVYNEQGTLREDPFIPLDGELVIFDEDENYGYKRFKFGNGVTNVIDLPFIGQSIIDVSELPSENINTQAFYRLTTAKLIINQMEVPENEVPLISVVNLPEIGEEGVWYYSVHDNNLFTYISEAIPEININAGWNLVDVLASIDNEIQWGGVITDITQATSDTTLYALVSSELYIYQDDWCKLAYGYEKGKAFDITWDGDMTGHLALDLSQIGISGGYYLVKVSDDVLSADDLTNASMTLQAGDPQFNGNGSEAQEFKCSDLTFDANSFPGALAIGIPKSGIPCFVIVHSVTELAAALGIPEGLYTNGTYFLSMSMGVYISRLVNKNAEIKKIERKFLDIPDIDNIASTYTADNNKAAIISNQLTFTPTANAGSKAFKIFHIDNHDDGTATAHVWNDSFTTTIEYHPQGITEVTCSPEMIEWYTNNGYTKENVQAALSELNTLIADANLNNERIYFNRHWLSTQGKASYVLSADPDSCTIKFKKEIVADSLYLQYRPDNIETKYLTNPMTFVHHPEIGVVDIVFDSVALGDETIVSQNNGFAAGTGSEVAGKYGTAVGVNALAGYGALAAGYVPEATGNAGVALGYYPKSNRHAGVAIGDHVEALSNNQFAYGRYNERDDQGVYAAILGYGTDEANRKNIHTVTRAGTGWFANDICFGGTNYTDATSIRDLVECIDRYITDGSGGLDYTLSANGTFTLANRGSSKAENVVVGSHVFGTAVNTVEADAFNNDSTIFNLRFKGQNIVIKDSAINTIGAFRNCANLTSVDFSGVIDIGAHSFRGCRRLSNINLKGVKKINGHAFHGSAQAKQIDTADVVEYIGDGAFLDVKLPTNVTFPSTLRHIGANAFGQNNTPTMVTVTFSSTPTYLSSTAFAGCTSITDIYVPWTEDTIIPGGGNNENKWGVVNATIHYAYIPSTEGLVYELSSDGTYYIVTGLSYESDNIVIADEIDGIPVTTIGDYAFSDHVILRSVIIPNSITNIGKYAFAANDGLTSVTIKGTPTISSDAFDYCEELTTINCYYAASYYNGAPWGATNATIHYNYQG